MTKEEIVKELRKVLNAVDITFPYRLELINAIEYLLKPSLPPNLDEAAFNYAELCKYEGGDKLLCVEHFKAGAEWQKEQMIKDAIELPVKIDAGGYPYIQITGIEFFDYDKDEPTAKEGDIVKIVIIREDGK